METTITRKSSAKQIEARIRKEILLTSGRKVAKTIGVHESQVTRWQAENGLVVKMAKLLDAIGYDSSSQDVIITNISGEEIRKLRDMSEHLRLPKKEASRLKNDEACEFQKKLCF
ncbi:MAG: CII family transcriptional regulator [Candidatus Phlomobacter fragariae]